MTAAEFDFQMPPGHINFGFIAWNGFLNSGDSTHLFLSVGGCPTGPVVAGTWTVFGFTAGGFCLVPSANGLRATWDCQAVPSAWPMGVVGYSFGAQSGCDDSICVIPVAVEPTTWGRTKSLYR